MVKPLLFKGDSKKASKKRKRAAADNAPDSSAATKTSTSTALTTTPSTKTSDAVPEDDSWVTAEVLTDITGPILLVLPSDPPSALASDPNGKVFASRLENMIESDPATAEPHDVRQVWIANRVAGSEKYTLKGHHGRYLSCDKFGVLTATREAVAAEEWFAIVPVADDYGAFAVQTEREKFFAVDPTVSVTAASSTSRVVRGDAEDIGFNSSIRIRMQARFKPKLKVAKEEKAREKISRKELEEMVGRRLEDDDVKRLKRARREGNFHEMLLDVKVKGKHDKFA
jgi:protein FRG1